MMTRVFSGPPSVGGLSIGANGEQKGSGTPNGNLSNRLVKAFFKTHQNSVENQHENEESVQLSSKKTLENEYKHYAFVAE